MKTLYMAAQLFAVAAMLAPAVAHADPLDDYVSRNGKAVCAALDKAQTGGDILRLSLTIAHAGGFSLKDAANVIARGVLRGTGDVRYAAVVGIATSWLTTPPLTILLGMHWGLGAVGGWIGLAVEILVGASLFWLRVGRGGWQPAAAAARRVMAGTAV